MDESDESYIDENLSDVCKALMLDSGIRSSNDFQSSHKDKPFSETFSFNKERIEGEKSAASIKSKPEATTPSRKSEEIVMHEIEYEIMKNKSENFGMTMEFSKADKPRLLADKAGKIPVIFEDLN